MLRRILSALHQNGVAFLTDEDGQDLIEYALLMAFVALAAVGVLGTLGTNITGIWNSVSNALTDAVTATS